MQDSIIAIPILVVIFTFVGGTVHLANRSKEKLARLRVLEQVLRDPANDNATRQEAIRGLDSRSWTRSVWGDWLRSNLIPRRVFGAVAWGLIVSGGLVVTLGSRYDFEAGIALLGVGFAILALPHVMRELDARKAPTP